MSETVQIALIAGLTTALPLIITQILTYLSQKKTLKEIHVQTNSNFTEQKKEIKAYKDQVENLIKEKGEAKGEENERSRKS